MVRWCRPGIIHGGSSLLYARLPMLYKRRRTRTGIKNNHHCAVLLFHLPVYFTVIMVLFVVNTQQVTYVQERWCYRVAHAKAHKSS